MQCERARLLGQLLWNTYTFAHGLDQEHQEPHDDALNAINSLLALLIDTPGPEACRILLDFSKQHKLLGSTKRLRLPRSQTPQRPMREFSALHRADIIALESSVDSEQGRLDSTFKFVLQLLNTYRRTAHGRISFLLVSSGVAIIKQNWIEALIGAIMKRFFDTNIQFPEVSPIYGVAFIALGIIFYLHGRRKSDKAQ